MWNDFRSLLTALRPAFSRKATYCWFVVVFVGFIVRYDTLGITSIVRALGLPPASYLCLLHFFHSTAWTVDGLMRLWWVWLAQKQVAHTVNGRIVLTGDHTKTPKDGRKIPAVTTLHQDSETGSKPSFFRGHDWGCIALVVAARGRFFSTPLLASIHEGLAGLSNNPKIPKTLRIILMAQQIARALGRRSYLALDAYFAAASVFTAARKELLDGEPLVHVLARSKKTTVGYHPAIRKCRRGPGRHKKYGKKIRLYDLFDSRARAYAFSTATASVYVKTETVRYLALNLLWKPTKCLVRFILIESSRGPIVLQTTDLTLDPLLALHLYCRRASIESMFDALKNTLGGVAYHFWSAYLAPASRRPRKNTATQKSSKPCATRNTFAAIEKFVNLQLLVLGSLQILAKLYPAEIVAKANCWLRTVSQHPVRVRCTYRLDQYHPPISRGHRQRPNRCDNSPQARKSGY